MSINYCISNCDNCSITELSVFWPHAALKNVKGHDDAKRLNKQKLIKWSTKIFFGNFYKNCSDTSQRKSSGATDGDGYSILRETEGDAHNCSGWV